MSLEDDFENDDPELDELVHAPHMPLGIVMMTQRSALKQLGIFDPDKQRLGRGEFGEAFQVSLGGRDSVIKFTRDPYEAVAAVALEGKNSRHVVNVHKIWSVPRTQPSPSFLPWYVVHRTLLSPLNERDSKLVMAMYFLYMDEGLDLRLPTPNAYAMQARWRTQLAEHLDSRQDIDRALALLVPISAGVREMAAVGIDWTDMHSGNLMRDAQGVLRISDIGYNNPREDTKVKPPPLTVESVQAYSEALAVPAAAAI